MNASLSGRQAHRKKRTQISTYANRIRFSYSPDSMKPENNRLLKTRAFIRTSGSITSGTTDGIRSDEWTRISAARSGMTEQCRIARLPD